MPFRDDDDVRLPERTSVVIRKHIRRFTNNIDLNLAAQNIVAIEIVAHSLGCLLSHQL